MLLIFLRLIPCWRSSSATFLFILFARRDAENVDDPLGCDLVPGISLLPIPLHIVAHACGVCTT